MILDSDALFQLMDGALWAEKEPYELRPWRFSREHIAHMESNDVYMCRSAASAGMKLDFKTDSSTLSFEIEAQPGAGTPWFGLDVMVDDQLYYHAHNKCGTIDTAVCLTLPEGMKRVTVYLPNLCIIKIRNVTLDDSAAVQLVVKKRKILFLGDSITQGYVAEHPSATYSNLMCHRLDAECLNQAIGGAVHNIQRMDETTGYRPDFMFAAYGTNDWSLQQNVDQNATEWCEKLHSIYGDIPLYVLLPIWRGDIAKKMASGCEDFLQARQQIADAFAPYSNCRVLDTIDFVPHSEDFFFDHVHPNEKGFACYANAVLNAVQNELR